MTNFALSEINTITKLFLVITILCATITLAIVVKYYMNQRFQNTQVSTNFEFKPLTQYVNSAEELIANIQGQDTIKVNKVIFRSKIHQDTVINLSSKNPSKLDLAKALEFILGKDVAARNKFVYNNGILTMVVR